MTEWLGSSLRAPSIMQVIAPCCGRAKSPDPSHPARVDIHCHFICLAMKESTETTSAPHAMIKDSFAIARVSAWGARSEAETTGNC